MDLLVHQLVQARHFEHELDLGCFQDRLDAVAVDLFDDQRHGHHDYRLVFLKSRDQHLGCGDFFDIDDMASRDRGRQEIEGAAKDVGQG